MACPRQQRVAALRQLAAADEPEMSLELAAAIDACAGQPESAWDGLLIAAAESATAPSAAVWVQPQPGAAARLWPPRSESPLSATLLRGALRWAAARGLPVVQALIDSGDEAAAARLRDSGLAQRIDLLYLAAQPGPEQRREALAARPRPGLRFEAVGSPDSPRLATLMSRIEEGSLDCPELQGARSPAQLIAGFRQQGQYAPQHWCILRDGEEDAGVLLLAPHPQTPSWELMYMGILPAWRGRGLGRELIAEALRRALGGGAERLVLSVDARNHPAREQYERAGFSLFATRSLCAWLAGQATAAGDCRDQKSMP